MLGRTFGSRGLSANLRVQVWAEVNGVKSGGGTIAGFDEMPNGAVIPAGTMVHLDTSGGVLTPIYSTLITDAVSGTEVEVASDNVPAVGSYVMLMPPTLDGTGTAIAVSAVSAEVNGLVTVTLASSLTAEEGDVLVGATAEGALVAIPNGLLWHDIVKTDGATMATGACVDCGRVYEDRIPPVPELVKKELVTIKFEKGI